MDSLGSQWINGFLKVIGFGLCALWYTTNVQLLSRKYLRYSRGETRLWNVRGDANRPLDDAGL